MELNSSVFYNNPFGYTSREGWYVSWEKEKLSACYVKNEIA